MLEANSLNKILHSNEWLLKAIRDIVTSYQVTLDSKSNWFRQSANEVLEECKAVLSLMANGKLESRQKGIRDFSLELIKTAEVSVNAVDTGNIAYWQKQNMKAYLRTNEELIRRGVKFSRVFVYPLEEIQKNLDLLKQQKEIGVDVYFSESKDLPKELVSDFLIVDGKIINSIEFTPDKRVVGNQAIVNKEQVNEFIHKFDTIMRYAKRLDSITG